jgi:hypothetical protein
MSHTFKMYGDRREELPDWPDKDGEAASDLKLLAQADCLTPEMSLHTAVIRAQPHSDHLPRAGRSLPNGP